MMTGQDSRLTEATSIYCIIGRLNLFLDSCQKKVSQSGYTGTAWKILSGCFPILDFLTNDNHRSGRKNWWLIVSRIIRIIILIELILIDKTSCSIVNMIQLLFYNTFINLSQEINDFPQCTRQHIYSSHQSLSVHIQRTFLHIYCTYTIWLHIS